MEYGSRMTVEEIEDRKEKVKIMRWLRERHPELTGMKLRRHGWYGYGIWAVSNYELQYCFDWKQVKSLYYATMAEKGE